MALKSLTKTLQSEFDSNNYKATQPITQSVTSGENRISDKFKNLPKEASSELINVVKDYDWTYSQNKGNKSDDIPYIYVKEFKMLGNSYISSLMTSALLFPDVAESNVGEGAPFNAFWNKIKSSFADNKFAQFMSSNASDITNKLSEKVTPYINWVSDQIKGIDNTADAWNNPDLKAKYAYLYLRKPTGRSYYFPYFENEYINIRNSFADTYEGENPITKTLENVSDLMSKTANMANIAAATEPGSYIQRAKFYDFKNEGTSIKVSFYLFNTFTPNVYIKNLELITKLVIQNTPHRHNRILVDPPCLYELTIPGKGFYPYAYISSLNVEHVGTKRMVTNGNRVIVPDAFKVNIEFQSLTMEVNNFLIPEMGTSNIDVSQRNGLRLNDNIPLPDVTSKTTEAKPAPAPQSPPPSTTIPVAINSPLGRSSTPPRLSMGF